MLLSLSHCAGFTQYTGDLLRLAPLRKRRDHLVHIFRGPVRATARSLSTSDKERSLLLVEWRTTCAGITRTILCASSQFALSCFQAPDFEPADVRQPQKVPTNSYTEINAFPSENKELRAEGELRGNRGMMKQSNRNVSGCCYK